MTRYKVFGIVAEGFQAVKEEFEKHFLQGIEENAQLCVYFEGNRVVDLWGTRHDGGNGYNQGYNGDSMTTLFSSSKVLTSIAMATLVDKQLLDYSDKVVKHWPEYGNGDKEKESMTVANILRHEGGMPLFSETQSLADIQSENIKKNSLGRIVEKEKLCFPAHKEETNREYHAFTRGTILNEIFRRIDPLNRTIGECIREDISLPLKADAFIGLKHEELIKSFNFSFSSIGKVTMQGFLPQPVRQTVPNIIELVKLSSFVLPYIKAKPILEHLTKKYDIEDMLNKFCFTIVKTGEIPSANGQGSARGIAKIAAMMANGGEIDGIQILSEETCNIFHADESDKKMYPTCDITSFTQGGVNVFKRVEHPVAFTKHNNDCRNGYVGWLGMGGSVFQWHPKLKIGFGYVPTFLAYEDVGNERGAHLQRRVNECVDRIIEERWVHIGETSGVQPGVERGGGVGLQYLVLK